MEKLDLEQGRWVPVKSMLSRRSTPGVAVLDGCLYPVGGFDGTNGLDTVEKYNLGKDLERHYLDNNCTHICVWRVDCKGTPNYFQLLGSK